jgi:hypothetical protein
MLGIAKKNLYALLWQQSCQIFTPKIPIWVNFWKVLQWKMLVYYMDIRSILRLFGIVLSQLVYFMAILVYFSPFWCVALRKIWQPWFGRIMTVLNLAAENAIRFLSCLISSQTSFCISSPSGPPDEA